MRQIILDTETTGMTPTDGHRVIEIGCLELINRRITDHHYQQYINPERSIDAQALAVHGITEELLSSQPRFNEIIEAFLAFVTGAQLIIHNAPFDIGFLNHELQLAGPKYGKITDYCTVIDTLVLARQLHPGQRNNLDALCKRYGVNNSQRTLHGALLDSELLALVYLAMTGGQTSFFSEKSPAETGCSIPESATRLENSTLPSLRVILATAEELATHDVRLAAIDKIANCGTVWKKIQE